METRELIRAAQMDLLHELKRVCDKHNIAYFLAEGTLIGAVRHKGFIPWDDDLDVAMLREDYEKFRKVYPQEQDPDYMLLDWNSDPNSPLPFLKLKIRGTHYREQIMGSSKVDDSLFIDIFPFDNVPENVKQRKRQKQHIDILFKILLAHCGYQLHLNSATKKLLFELVRFVARLRPLAAWKRTYEKIETQYNYQPTKYVDLICSKSLTRFCERKTLEDLVDYPFESGMYPIPRDYDSFLRGIYGDYMQLPPENERVGVHYIQKIDLGNYTIRNK